MRIVIVTPLPYWNVAIEELVAELKGVGFNVIVVDFAANFQVLDSNGIIDVVPNVLRKYFIFKIFRKLFGRIVAVYMINRFFRQGDVVNFHFILPKYYKHMERIKRNSSCIISTFLGSDLFRVKIKHINKVAKIIDSSDKISIAETMQEDLLKKFTIDINKVKYARFGSRKLNDIYRICHLDNVNSFRDDYSIQSDKIVITCGYNAIEAQQHILMLDKISELHIDIRRQMCILLPMTYGKNNYYLSKVKKKISEVDFDCVIFEKRMTDEEVVKFRFVSDIVLNIQKTDALAGSIQESLMAGNIVLVGDWLPYSIYDRYDIYYLKTNLSDISKNLTYIIENIDLVKEKCKNNKDKIFELTSWNSRISDWEGLYS